MPTIHRGAGAPPRDLIVGVDLTPAREALRWALKQPECVKQPCEELDFEDLERIVRDFVCTFISRSTERSRQQVHSWVSAMILECGLFPASSALIADALGASALNAISDACRGVGVDITEVTHAQYLRQHLNGRCYFRLSIVSAPTG